MATDFNALKMQLRNATYPRQTINPTTGSYDYGLRSASGRERTHYD